MATRNEDGSSEFIDALSDPSWGINDSISMIEYHAKKLEAAGAITAGARGLIVAALPNKMETPDLDIF